MGFSQQQSSITSTTGVVDRSAFVSKVYGLLGGSLLFASGAAYYALDMPPSMLLPMFIAEIVVLILAMIFQRAFPFNLVLLFTFATVSGFTLGPVLNSYVHRGMGDLIPIALGITSVTFGGLSAYVHISKKDFSFLGGALFMGLIGMLLVGIASTFFKLPISSSLYSGFGVLLFSGYILYDTSNLLRRYDDGQYVSATLALYLDFINLFLNVLRLLSGNRK